MNRVGQNDPPTTKTRHGHTDTVNTVPFSYKIVSTKFKVKKIVPKLLTIGIRICIMTVANQTKVKLGTREGRKRKCTA